MRMEELVIGADHIDKIGKVVSVDVDSLGGRYIVSGVLTLALDTYSANADLSSTVLTVGGQAVTLDWDSVSSLRVGIGVVDTAEPRAELGTR